jgi:ornithine--oxo-acid transaminase
MTGDLLTRAGRSIDTAVAGPCAPNYDPLPVTLRRGSGAWVEDDHGHRYLDFLSAYSALNFGHCHPRLVAIARRQLTQLTLTSRAYGTDNLEPFCRDLAEICAMEMVVPMNTGAEAVETAIKTVRRWGYTVKGVPADRASIVVCAGNFHGRTTTLVGFSSEPGTRSGFGPFTPGFVSVPFGDADALADAITGTTVAVLLEPIQGEAGVVVPPDGYLRDVRRLCTERGVLLVADEIQSGLGRTGRTFACDHEGIRPDLFVLGKALGGGIVPLSAVVGSRDVLGVLSPGTHGSTFGGNPLACAIGREVIAMLRTGEYQDASARLGAGLHARMRELLGRGVTAIRGRGLWAGLDLDDRMPPAREVAEHLLHRRVLTNNAHARTLRIAPPLVIHDADLDWGVDQIVEVTEMLWTGSTDVRRRERGDQHGGVRSDGVLRRRFVGAGDAGTTGT